jgi:hypothetical protein
MKAGCFEFTSWPIYSRTVRAKCLEMMRVAFLSVRPYAVLEPKYVTYLIDITCVVYVWVYGFLISTGQVNVAVRLFKNFIRNSESGRNTGQLDWCLSYILRYYWLPNVKYKTKFY